MNERINELFADCFGNLDTWAKVCVHNYYITYGDGCGEEILENTEDELNMIFTTPYEVLQAITDEYNVNDDYMWVDGLGNLYSADSENEIPLANVDEMAEYFYENPSYLKDFKEFNEWYYAVEYGFDEDDEEEEEED